MTIDSKCIDCICYGKNLNPAIINNSFSIFKPIKINLIFFQKLGSTKCNLKMKCSGSFCGSFLISRSYWVEGGELLGNYVNCANDFNCAKQTVANYMARYNRDCDLNQDLTCEDFAIIHQTGGFECEKNAKQVLF